MFCHSKRNVLRKKLRKKNLFIYLFINPINADRQAQGSVSDPRENVTDTPFITTRTSN